MKTKYRIYSDIRDRDTYFEIKRYHGIELVEFTVYSLQYFIEENGFQDKPENVQYFQWLLYIASKQKGIELPYYIMIMAQRIFEYDLINAYRKDFRI